MSTYPHGRACPYLICLGLLISPWGCEDPQGGQGTTVDARVSVDAMLASDVSAPLDSVPMIDAHRPKDAASRDGDVDSAMERLSDADTLDAIVIQLDGSTRDLSVPQPVDAAIPDAEPLVPDVMMIPRERLCNDQMDDDGDDRVDCEDSDCRGAPVCFDLREVCDDGRDNNGDDRVDCDDVTCHLEPGCPPPEVEAFTTEQVEARFLIDCVPCHGAPQPEVQLDLTPPFLDRILNVPSFQVDLPYIKSGDAAQSWIYHKIRYRQVDFMGDGDGMPPEHTWTAQDVQRLGLWIDTLPER